MKKLLTLIFALVAVMACAFDNGDFTYTIMSDGTAPPANKPAKPRATSLPRIV